MFGFVRNCQTIFQSGYTILQSHQQWMRVPVAPHPCQHLVLSVFWILAILIGMLVISWFNSVSYDIWHWALFHMHTCPLNIFFADESVQIFLPLFLNWIVSFLRIILHTRSLSDMHLQIFLQVYALFFFILLILLFENGKKWYQIENSHE